MSIHVALHHRTSYQYERPVEHGAHVVSLRPAPHCRSNILAYSLKVGPMKHFINWQQDPQANYLARLVFPEPTARSTSRWTWSSRCRCRTRSISSWSRSGAISLRLRRGARPRAGAVPRGGKPGPLLAGSVDRFKDKTGRTIDVLVEINSPCRMPSTTRSGWSRACSRRKRRWKKPRAPAATPPGCWSRCCATSGWQAALSRAT